MTEVILKRLESVNAELEEMTRSGLFSKEQCRVILKRRKEYQQKVSSSSKSLQDYFDYIQYEKIILKIIGLRRSKYQIADSKSSMEHKIINRIKNVYDIAMQKHPDSLSLCLDHFKFCKDSLFTNLATKVIQITLKHHSNNIDVLLIASKWYAQECKDVNTAIATLHKGIVINKSNGSLYNEIIKLESSKVYGGVKELSQELINRFYNIIQKCVESMLKNVLDAPSFLQSLTYLEYHVSTMPLQNIIVRHLLDKHYNCVEVWHALAQRERNGFHYGDSVERTTSKIKLTLCFERYKEGLRIICPENRKALWIIYIDSLMDLCQEENAVSKVSKTAQLREAIEEASGLNFLSEKNYIMWFQIVNDKEANDVLIRATTSFPKSTELWKIRLRYNIVHGNKAGIMTVFNEGNAALGDESLPLYFSVLKYMILGSSKDEINFFYQNAVKQNKIISDAFKPKYLEWLAIHESIGAARAVYEKLAHLQPYCKGLHETMYLLETTRHHEKPAADLQEWVKILTLAIEQFGTEDVDVWVNYIHFYKDYYTVADVKDKIQIALDKAKESLSEYMYITLEEKILIHSI